jgi:hypothetical protein
MTPVPSHAALPVSRITRSGRVVSGVPVHPEPEQVHEDCRRRERHHPKPQPSSKRPIIVAPGVVHTAEAEPAEPDEKQQPRTKLVVDHSATGIGVPKMRTNPSCACWCGLSRFGGSPGPGFSQSPKPERFSRAAAAIGGGCASVLQGTPGAATWPLAFLSLARPVQQRSQRERAPCGCGDSR